MGVTLPKPTATTFIARLALDASNTVEITIFGSGLTYDKSGAILSGEVHDISIGHLKLNHGTLALVETNKASGLDYPADKLADLFGTKYWNDPKLVYSVFDKLAHLHEGVSQGYFSPLKSYMEGTERSDDLTGSAYNDHIAGGGGDDALSGGYGNDSIYGGAGDDDIWGDTGNDLLIDTEGNNTMDGGFGVDRIRGGRGTDLITGGAGHDLLDGGGGSDTLWGGTGADQFIFDLKAPGAIRIADFSVKEDQLINLRGGTAEEAYKDFITHAHQDGRHVVYDEGETHLVLRYVKLGDLTLHNFADSAVALESGLY